jgi:hypothetical protein
VPVATTTLGLTIVAHDIDNPLKIRRHWLFGNVSSTSFPSGSHALLRDYSLFANGAAIVKARKFAKAMSMNGYKGG